MSTHTTKPAAAATSPKITAGLLAFAGLIVLQAVIAAVTGLGVVVAAYLKGDPLRNLGGAVADMCGTTVPPTDTVAPVDAAPAELPEARAEDGSADASSPVADYLLTEVDELTATRTRSGSTTAGGVL